MGRIRNLFRRRPMFSLVAAAYNVAPYIDAFFESVIAQSYGVAGVEVIVINDGSTDDTGAILDRWAARYPDLIRCIHQTNGGVAAARNAGLAQAKGTWIGFPDPDDILHDDYLMQLAQAMATKPMQVALVANLIRYIEETQTHENTHPMRYRFKKTVVSQKVSKTRDMILQSVSHAVFRRASIVAYGLRFDTAILPTFEDGHFANALLIHESDKTISFVPDAVYYYRKRAALGSAVDGSRDDPRWYTTQIETGYLSLIKLSRDVCGHVPVFVQVNCLYSMMWRFRHLVDQPAHAAILDPAAQAVLCAHLDRIFAVIDYDVIMRFNRAGSSEMHKVALLARYGKGLRDPLRIQPVQITPTVFEFQWYIGPNQPVTLIPWVNGKQAPVVAQAEHYSEFLGQPYATRVSLQIQVIPSDVVHFTAPDGRALCIRDRGIDLGVQIDASQLTQLRPLPVALR